MKIKNKFWKFAVTGLGITAATSSIGVALVSCANNTNETKPNFYEAETKYGNVFTSVKENGKIASPSIDFVNYMKSLLMNPDVSSKFFTGVANLSVLTWFKNVATANETKDSKIAATYNKWLTEIGLDPFTGNPISNAKDQGTAQTKIKEYKDKYGNNWEKFMQNEVWNTAGGTKLAWIQSLYLEKVKTEFINIIFEDPTMLMMASDGQASSPKYFELNSNFKKNVNNPKYVNSKGNPDITGTNVGDKNNFVFTAEASDQKKGTAAYTLQEGYADFLDYALDQYIATEMPLMSNMALFKPTAPVTNDVSQFFNVNYFSKDTIGTEGSYKFQCYQSTTGDQIGSIDVNDKWNGAINQIKEGPQNAIDSKTGVINIDKKYTDDSSTYMVNDATKIFNDTVTPFAAAVAYKFNTIWAQGSTATSNNVIDKSMLNLNSNSIDQNQIMNNFLVYKNGTNSNAVWKDDNQNLVTSNGTKNYLKFPYDTINAFNGTNYNGAVGVIDTVNITKGNTGGETQTPFIITRNEFGVHIVGIDRYDALVNAIKRGGSNANDSLKYLRNEIRNTATYRYAVYLTNGNDTTNGFNLKEKLQTYVSDNFDSLILNYLKDTTRTKNLFTSLNLNSTNSTKVKINDAVLVAAEAFRNLKNGINVQTNINTINSKMYENQSAYLANQKPEEWKNNGIAGVLPYTRDSNSGSFNALAAIESMTLLAPKASNGTSIDKFISTLSNDYSTKLSAMLTNFVDGGEIVVNTKIQNSSQIFIDTKNPVSDITNKSTLNCLNYAIGNVSSIDFANPIILNRYIQYLINEKIIVSSPTTTFDSIFNTSKVPQQLINAISSLYLVSNFTSQKQLFNNGDVKSNDNVVTISKKIFTNNLMNNLGKDSNGNIIFNKTSTQSLDFFKFLLGLNYLLKNNYKNFVDYLSNEIDYGEQAFISWVRSDSIKALNDFGLHPSSDFAFKEYQPYLTNNNGYAYINAIFDITTNGDPASPATTSNITYTTDSKYWNAAPINDGTVYNGFYGLQTLDSNTLPSILTDGTSSNTNVFSNNVWQNNFTNDGNTTHNFTGSMYQYGSLNEYITNKLYDKGVYKINTISEFESLVKDFSDYNFDVIANDQVYSDAVDEYLNVTLINKAREKLEYGIQSFITFIKMGNESKISVPLPTDQSGITPPSLPTGGNKLTSTIPSTAFTQYTGNLCTTINNGTKSSNVFNDGTTNLGTEIYVEQLNHSKIQEAKKSSSQPWVALGINESLFYSLVVNAAMNPEIQNQGVSEMNKAFEKINVYDVRLNDALPIIILNNHKNQNEEK